MDGTLFFPLFRQRSVPVFVIQELVTIRVEFLLRAKTFNVYEISIRDLMKYVKRSEVSWDGYGYCSRQEMGIIYILHADAGANHPILFSSRKNIFQLCNMAALWSWSVPFSVQRRKISYDVANNTYFFGFGNKKWNLFCSLGFYDWRRRHP